MRKKYSKNICDEILPTTTIAELKYLIFGIPSADLHIQLYSYLQNNYVSGAAVRTIDDFLAKQGAPRKKSTRQGKGSISTILRLQVNILKPSCRLRLIL